jgi:tetratricopeptide (TPR) repeat protein
MPSDRTAKTRLTTWKEVAAFFGKTERTVMRWEAERGLPVRRLPGKARSGIYADVAELEAWLRGAGAAPADALAAGETVPPAADPTIVGAAARPPEEAATRRGARAPIVLAGLGAAALVALALLRLVPAAPHAPPAAAHALYLEGLRHWAQRTPAGLTQAAEEFTAATRLDPDYAAAYAGLAGCYNLLREFGSMPSAQAYPLAKQAAQRALALDPGLAAGHAAYGFALFYGDWRFKQGLDEFARALRLEPGNPTFHHWYGNALASAGQYDAALAQLDRAAELDPASPKIRADRALALLIAGRAAEARAVLEDLAGRLPDFVPAHKYFAYLALLTGDDAVYLREATRGATLRHNAPELATLGAARDAYGRGGQTGMLQALLRARLSAFEAGSGSAGGVAVIYALLGDRAESLAYLTRGLDRHDEDAFAGLASPFWRGVVGEAAAAALRARAGLPPDEGG